MPKQKSSVARPAVDPYPKKSGQQCSEPQDGQTGAGERCETHENHIDNITTSAQPKRRCDGSPPSAMNVPGDLCGHCGKKCTMKGKSSEAIQCDVCFEWVHATCEGFSREQYKVFNQLVTAFSNITQ